MLSAALRYNWYSGCWLITAGKKPELSHRKVTMQAKPSEERKGNTPSGCSGRTALRREQCRVFTPFKNCKFETRSRDYATVDEAVFSTFRAELVVPCGAVLTEPRLASPRLASLSLSDKCKRLDRAKIGTGHVTSASVLTSRVSAMKQQQKHCGLPRVWSRVYRRDWSPFSVSSQLVLGFSPRLNSSRWGIEVRFQLALDGRQPREVSFLLRLQVMSEVK
jgi:hypothetical protein